MRTLKIVEHISVDGIVAVAPVPRSPPPTQGIDPTELARTVARG